MNTLKKVWALLTLSLVAPFCLAANAPYNTPVYIEESGYPSADVSSCNSCRYGVEIDWLYWQMRGLNPVAYETTSTGTPGTAEGQQSEQKCISPKQKFDSGIRVAFWYNNPCTCLNFGVIWTDIRNKTDKSFSSNESNTLVNDALGAGYTLSNFDGKNRSNVGLNYLDLDLSYRYELPCCFTMTPHLGVRLFELDYSVKNHIDGVYSTNNYTTNTHSKWKAKDRAWGIEGGLWLSWKTQWCFDIFGHAGASVLSYSNKVHATANVASAQSTGPNASSKLHCKNHTTSTMFNYALGVQYDTCICKRDVSLRASWESVHLDYYYLQWQGLTLGLAFKF